MARGIENLIFDQSLHLEVWEREAEEPRTRALGFGCGTNLGHKGTQVGKYRVVLQRDLDEMTSPGFRGGERIRPRRATGKNQRHRVGRGAIHDEVVTGSPRIEQGGIVGIAAQILATASRRG